MSSSTSSDLELIKYSEKSVALFSESEATKNYTTELKGIGGKYNPILRHVNAQNTEVRKPGWIFPLSKQKDVEKLMASINSGAVTPSPPQASSSSANLEELRKIVMALSTRIERLEQELFHSKNSASSSSSIVTTEEDVEDQVQEQTIKHSRLLPPKSKKA